MQNSSTPAEDLTVSDSDNTAAAQYIFAVISILIAVIGVASNSLSLSYFLSKNKSYTTLQARPNSTTRLFIVLNVFDLILCVYSTIMIVVWIEVLNLELPTTFKYFCVIYQVILVNLTGFITCVIAVTRTINLVFPFNSSSEQQMITNVAIVVYGLVNICLAIFEMIHVHRGQRDDITYIALIIIAINMTGLFVIVIISNLICMVKLCRTRPESIAAATRHATITVGIISVIYCFCNAGFVSDRVSYAITHVLPSSLASIAFHSILLPLNSACNPVVYFVRKADMRLYLINMWETVHSFCRGVDR